MCPQPLPEWRTMCRWGECIHVRVFQWIFWCQLWNEWVFISTFHIYSRLDSEINLRKQWWCILRRHNVVFSKFLQLHSKFNVAETFTPLKLFNHNIILLHIKRPFYFQISMNVSPTLVRMEDYVSIGWMHTRASVPVDILVSTVKLVSIYFISTFQRVFRIPRLTK